MMIQRMDILMTLEQRYSTKIRTLHLEYDIIEIHLNTNLKNKPYLVRCFSYHNNDPAEIRCDDNDLKNLYNILKEHKLL